MHSIVKNLALFSDPELNYAAHGIRKEFFNFYIGKFEAELLAHTVLLYADMRSYLFCSLFEHYQHHFGLLSHLAKHKHQFNHQNRKDTELPELLRGAYFMLQEKAQFFPEPA